MSMLVAEAAERWGVPTIECTARNSIVSHARSSRTIRYGEIAEAASRRPIPNDIPLKDPKEWHLIGQPARRFDTAEKTLGKPIYTSDVQLPNMLNAAISQCRGSQLCPGCAMS